MATSSTMMPLGTRAPDFDLLDTESNRVRRSDADGRPLLVIFMCNHCPYVKHIARAMAALTAEYMRRGVAVVGINSNDPVAYPADSIEAMMLEREERGYAFPYLFDETQQVAKSYTAACTPDFFLFDPAHLLFYRGRFDSSRPRNEDPITGADLTHAVDAVLAGAPAPDPQFPSMGCGVKWRAGNEPSYAQ